MRDEYTELLASTEPKKARQYWKLSAFIILGFFGMAAFAHTYSKSVSSSLPELAVGAGTCDDFCKAQQPVINVIPGMKKNKCKAPHGTGSYACTPGSCCLVPKKSTFIPTKRPTVPEFRQDKATFTSSDKCTANENKDFPEDYKVDLSALDHDQFRTLQVTRLGDDVKRPLTGIPDDAVIWKNSVTAKKGDKYITVSLTTGTDKPCPKVFSVKAGSSPEEIIQLTEDRSGGADGYGQKIQDWLTGAASGCSMGPKKKDQLYNYAYSAYVYSMPQEDLGGARDGEFSAVARFVKPPKPGTNAAQFKATDVWVANGYIMTFYLTKSEICEFLQPTNKKSPKAPSRDLYMIRQDRTDIIKWELPLVKWKKAAKLKPKNNPGTTYQSGVEYELKAGTGGATGFRPENLDRLFGPWKGTRPDKAIRDPREFAISLDMALHGNEPLYMAQNNKWWLALDTDRQGAAQIFEWVTAPYDVANVARDLESSVKELKCVMNFDHREKTKKAGDTEEEAPLSKHTYRFLDWVLDSQNGMTNFNLHNKAQKTTGAYFDAKTKMTDIVTDFVQKVRSKDNDKTVGDADKGSGNLMKISAEQYYAYCGEFPDVKGCNGVTALKESMQLTAWDSLPDAAEGTHIGRAETDLTKN